MGKSTFYALEMLSLTGTHIQKTEKSKKKKKKGTKIKLQSLKRDRSNKPSWKR